MNITRKTTVSMVYTDGINKAKVHTEFVGKVTMYYITGYNPLPIHGKFYSSFSVLNKWLIDNGYIPIPCTKQTVIEIIEKQA